MTIGGIKLTANEVIAWGVVHKLISKFVSGFADPIDYFNIFISDNDSIKRSIKLSNELSEYFDELSFWTEIIKLPITSGFINRLLTSEYSKDIAELIRRDFIKYDEKFHNEAIKDPYTHLIYNDNEICIDIFIKTLEKICSERYSYVIDILKNLNIISKMINTSKENKNDE